LKEDDKTKSYSQDKEILATELVRLDWLNVFLKPEKDKNTKTFNEESFGL